MVGLLIPASDDISALRCATMGQGRSSPRPTTREEQMAESTDTRDRTATSNPSDLVRAAVEALMTQFFEPLAVDELLSDGWAGATSALCVLGDPRRPGNTGYQWEANGPPAPAAGYGAARLAARSSQRAHCVRS